MYKDTTGYFRESELKIFLQHTELIKNFKIVLEIGSYEGIFSCFAAENFAEEVHTIDPFDIKDPGTSVKNDTEENFYYNKSICPSNDKIYSYKQTSKVFFENNTKTFDLIYVDGSHEPEDAYYDLNNSIKVCNSGGVIWIDDYGSNYKNINLTIDKWLNENKENITIIHMNYQVGLIKN
jgi:hypothetical protein